MKLKIDYLYEVKDHGNEHDNGVHEIVMITGLSEKTDTFYGSCLRDISGFRADEASNKDAVDWDFNESRITFDTNDKRPRIYYLFTEIGYKDNHPEYYL